MITPWASGRFDARPGPSRVLFGQMYEDTAIELRAFSEGPVFCIASAGSTAMALAAHHPVVAVDINRRQLDYAAQRLAGAPAVRGTAEHVMAFGRMFAPLVGWSRPRVREFLSLEDPATQLAFWHERLNTRRFRTAFDAAFSLPALRSVYSAPFLDFLPPHLGAVMRARLERGFAVHPNCRNPWARALLLGELDEAPGKPLFPVELACADAAGWLESAPPASFAGFSLSNILDGAGPAYRARLFAAVRRTAKPHAVAVLRSFSEPPIMSPTNHAADDRALLWGVVDVRPAASLR